MAIRNFSAGFGFGFQFFSQNEYLNLRYFFHLKNVCKISNNRHALNWKYGFFGQNYRFATLLTFYLTEIYFGGLLIDWFKVCLVGEKIKS